MRFERFNIRPFRKKQADHLSYETRIVFETLPAAPSEGGTPDRTPVSPGDKVDAQQITRLKAEFTALDGKEEKISSVFKLEGGGRYSVFPGARQIIQTQIAESKKAEEKTRQGKEETRSNGDTQRRRLDTGRGQSQEIINGAKMRYDTAKASYDAAVKQKETLEAQIKSEEEIDKVLGAIDGLLFLRQNQENDLARASFYEWIDKGTYRDKIEALNKQIAPLRAHLPIQYQSIDDRGTMNTALNTNRQNLKNHTDQSAALEKRIKELETSRSNQELLHRVSVDGFAQLSDEQGAARIAQDAKQAEADQAFQAAQLEYRFWRNVAQLAFPGENITPEVTGGRIDRLSSDQFESRIRAWELKNQRTLVPAERLVLERFLPRGLDMRVDDSQRAVLSSLFLKSRTKKRLEATSKRVERNPLYLAQFLKNEVQKLKDSSSEKTRSELETRISQAELKYRGFQDNDELGSPMKDIMRSVCGTLGVAFPDISFSAPSDSADALEAYVDTEKGIEYIERITTALKGAEKKDDAGFTTLLGIAPGDKTKQVETVNRVLGDMRKLLESQALSIAQGYIDFFTAQEKLTNLSSFISSGDSPTITVNAETISTRIRDLQSQKDDREREKAAISRGPDSWKDEDKMISKLTQQIALIDAQINGLRPLISRVEGIEAAEPAKAQYTETQDNPIFDLHSEPQDRFNALTDTILYVNDILFPKEEGLDPINLKVRQFLVHICLYNSVDPAALSNFLQSLRTDKLIPFYDALGNDLKISESPQVAVSPSSALGSTPPWTPPLPFSETKKFLTGANVSADSVLPFLKPGANPQEIIDQFKEKTNRESLQESKERRDILDAKYHDRYFQYKNLIDAQANRGWIDSNPEYFAGNWFDADGNLKTNTRDEIIRKILPIDSQGKVRFKDKDILASDLFTKITANDSDAIAWVRGLQSYIQFYRGEGGQEIQANASLEEAQRGLNRTKPGLGDILVGIKDKLVYGDFTDKAQVGILAAALWFFARKFTGARTALFALGGLWALDAIQADTTDLFGGQRLFDKLISPDFADVRGTPLGAFLNESDLKGPMEQKAGLIMTGIPISQLLDWSEPILLEMQPGTEPKPRSAGMIYMEKIPPQMRSQMTKMFPQYRGKDEFKGAMVFWSVFEKFLVRSSGRATYHKDDNTPSAFKGFNYIRARYTNESKIPEGYEQYRKDIGNAHERYAKQPPLFSLVLEHEMSRTDIIKSVSENQTAIEWMKQAGKDIYDKYGPLLVDAKDWTIAEAEKLFDYLRHTAFPLAKAKIAQLASQGWRIAKDTYESGKNWLVLTYASHRVTIEKVKAAGIWLIKAPFRGVEWMIETTEENLPKILEKLRHIKDNYVMGWYEALTNSTNSEQERLISSGDDILAALKDMGIDDDIKTVYGFVRDDDLRDLCTKLVDDGDFVTMINSFRGPANVAKSSTNNAKDMTGTYAIGDNITQGEIARLFLMSSLGTASALNLVANTGISAERGLVEFVDFLRALTITPLRVVYGVGTVGFSDMMKNLDIKAQQGIQKLKIDKINVRSVESFQQMQNFIEVYPVDDFSTPGLWTMSKVISYEDAAFSVAAASFPKKSDDQKSLAKAQLHLALTDMNNLIQLLRSPPGPTQQNLFNALVASAGKYLNAT